MLSIKVNPAENEVLVICESPGESEQRMSARHEAGRRTDVVWMRAVITSHRKPTRALQRRESHRCPEGRAPRDESLGGLHVKPSKKHTQHRKLHSACSPCSFITPMLRFHSCLSSHLLHLGEPQCNEQTQLVSSLGSTVICWSMNVTQTVCLLFSCLSSTSL